MITYGTAGFRYNEEIMKKIAFKIGVACAKCSYELSSQLGIMITASHNEYTDNGVKLIMSNGEYITPNLELLVNEIVNSDDIYTQNKTCGFIIGKDTRRSCDEILNLIISGICSVDKYCKINFIGYTTTPELHYYTAGQKNYIQKYKTLYNNLNITKSGCIVDCANGVGYLALNNFNLSELTLINTNVNDHKLLNNKCGSDHVINNQLSSNHFLACFDGDADRIIFVKDKLIFDGDYISALVATYLKYFNCQHEIVVVHTSYSNKSFVDYIKTLNIKTICVATGVKNLHHVAKQYDIGIYFEANGHGTVLCKEYVYDDFPLLELFSQLVGDSICNLLGVLSILNTQIVSVDEWGNLFTKVPFKLYALDGYDKTQYKLDENETKLIEPEGIQDKLDQLDGRVFIRPSGTENKLRVYIESCNNINELFDQTVEILKN